VVFWRVLTHHLTFNFVSRANNLQNRIDRDQQLIAELSEAGDFTTAKNVYELGAFSKVVATLTLSEGLPVALDKGAQLHGMVDTATSSQRSSIGDVIVTTYDAYPAGTTDIKVKYHTENCYVGANPAPILTGCKCYSQSMPFVFCSKECLHRLTNLTVSYRPCSIGFSGGPIIGKRHTCRDTCL